MIDVDARRIVAKAAALGLTHSCASPSRPHLGMQFITAGHIVMSRYRIKRHDWQYFSRQTTIESFLCSRGSMYVELQMPDGSPLHLGACHTTSGTDVVVEALHLQHTQLYCGGNPTALLQVQEWAQQVSEQVARSAVSSERNLLPALATQSSKPIVIMCGDLNITPHDRTEYLGVCKALAAVSSGGGGGNGGGGSGSRLSSQLRDVFDGTWEPTFGMSETDERLLTQTADVNAQKTVDYIFATHAPEHTAVDAMRATPLVRDYYQQVSDHCALIARWSW